MYGSQRPFVPNDLQRNRHRTPYNPQWRPFHGPRVPFSPRNQGFYNHGPPMHDSEEYWCEKCDRGFPSEYLLNKHQQQHQKCNIDGCQFIAHPKVITKHIQMQHSSGLYKKIAKLNNPEEIEKWRQERKKKYPTKVNIDKKAAELKEKIDRGEKMNLGRKDWQNKRDIKNNQNRSFDSSEQGVKRSYNYPDNNQPNSKFRKPNRKKTPRTPKILPAPEHHKSLAPFAGIQCLEMDNDKEVNENINNDLIEDSKIKTIIDEDLGDNKSTIVEKSDVCNALLSLMCEYGSSDEEINDIDKSTHKQSMSQQISKCDNTKKGSPKEVKHATVTCAKYHEVLINPSNHNCDKNNVNANEKTSIVKPKEIKLTSVNSIKDTNDINNKLDEKTIDNDKLEKNSINIVDNDDDNDSGPEELKVDKNIESANIAQENNESVRIVKKQVSVVKRKLPYRKPKPKLPSTLIYRLLSKEMKQERNKVLQCIRYIRKSNYFDKTT